MQNLKFFLNSINILNVLLLALIVFMVHYSVLPFFYTDIKYTFPTIKKAVGESEKSGPELDTPSPTEYLIISDDNLFHPERIIPREKKVELVLPKPDFILYGTLVSDDFGVAYLEDIKAPRSSSGRGKRQIAVRKGDVLSGFTLKEIESNRVVMVRGEERITVNIFDKRKPRPSESPVPLVQPKSVQPAQVVQPTRQPAPAQQKAVGLPQPETPQEKRVRPPPRSSSEAIIRDFFDRQIDNPFDKPKR